MYEIQSSIFHKVKELLDKVEFNTLFAQSVIKNHVSGQVFTDDISHPKTAYIRHPYGMSLLVGCHTNEKFNRWLLDYISGRSDRMHSDDWMQVAPFEWNKVIEKGLIHNEINRYVEKCTRVNFSFNCKRYEKLKEQLDYKNVKIEKMNHSQFMKFKGKVIPRLFWDRYEDIDRKGMAYTALENDDIASIAYSAYVHGNKLEIGIETAEKYRNKGYALKACSRLIDYCIINDMDPVWACKLENTSSYRLASRLGFDEKARYPYYGLMNPHLLNNKNRAVYL